MDEFLMQAFVEMALEMCDEASSDDCTEIEPVASICTFERAMLLTSNRGLVVTFQDGTEFQVTIVQTK